MKIRIREFYFDKDDKPKYKFFSIKGFIPKNKYQNNFIKKLKILEQDPLFEKAVLDARKASGITFDFILRTIKSYKPYPIDLYLKEVKDKDKHYQLSKRGNDICLNFGLDVVSTFDLIFLDSILIPEPEKPIVSWIEPNDKNFPNYVNGAISILINWKITRKTEFEDVLNKLWPKVRELSSKIRCPYEITFPHIRDLDEYLKIFELYKQGLPYKKITKILRENNIFYEEATLRQIVKKIKDNFVNISGCENNNEE